MPHDVVAELDDLERGGGGEEGAQRFLAIDERDARQVVAVEVEEIEDEVTELRRGCRSGVLERMEARDAALVEDGDLAVEERRLGGDRSDRVRDGREALRPVVAVPAHEPCLAALDAPPGSGSRRA